MGTGLDIICNADVDSRLSALMESSPKDSKELAQLVWHTQERFGDLPHGKGIPNQFAKWYWRGVGTAFQRIGKNPTGCTRALGHAWSTSLDPGHSILAGVVIVTAEMIRLWGCYKSCVLDFQETFTLAPSKIPLLPQTAPCSGTCWRCRTMNFFVCVF